MKKYFLFLMFLSALTAKGQYTNNYLNLNDIRSALSTMGLNIYKYSLSSPLISDFNLSYEEYLDGKCLDSAILVDEDQRTMLEHLFNKSISITKDTCFLKIYVKSENDSVYNFNFEYPNTGFRKKEICIPYSKYGRHFLSEIASPKITGKGKYPVLFLSMPISQEVNGVKLQVLAIPPKIEQLKKLVSHFYVISVFVD